MIGPGFAYHYKDKSIDDRPLWMVISDPTKNDKNIVVVNATTWFANKDQSCILLPQHHTSITHKSVVAYNFARVTSASIIQGCLDNRDYNLLPALRDEVLEMVREGAALSQRIGLSTRKILAQQELI